MLPWLGIKFIVDTFILELHCHTLGLVLMTKAKACRGVGQEWNLKVTFCVPRNVEECEGMNPHTPKWAPTLGVGVPMDSRIF